MEHIGIDLGSKESQVCVRNGVGEIVEEKRCRTDQLGRYLGKRAPGRVVLETCTEAFRIAGGARQQGHDVRVVAATLVRSLGVGQRGLKNDRRDARALSEASCRMELPSVHIPSVVSQEVKAICVSREALIKTRTQLVSRVRSYVRSRLGAPLRATPESLPGKIKRALLADAEGLPAHPALVGWVRAGQAERTQGTSGLMQEDREEVVRLRTELRLVQEARDILTKAAADFATQSR